MSICHYFTVLDDKPVVLYGMSAYVSATVVTTYSTPKQTHAKEVFQMDKKYLENDECAVSPVIGVILMVAVTVTLASIVGSAAFGMGSNINKMNLG